MHGIFFIHRVFKKDTDTIQTEPKFIVFLTQLLSLFEICRFCKADGVHTEIFQHGTMAEVKVTCPNSACLKKVSTWRSQPNFTGTQTPAGNLLLSFAILVAGASASKMLRVLKHMGVVCISLRTFFLHQRVNNKLMLQSLTKIPPGSMVPKFVIELHILFSLLG